MDDKFLQNSPSFFCAVTPSYDCISRISVSQELFLFLLSSKPLLSLHWDLFATFIPFSQLFLTTRKRNANCYSLVRKFNFHFAFVTSTWDVFTQYGKSQKKCFRFFLLFRLSFGWKFMIYLKCYSSEISSADWNEMKFSSSLSVLQPLQYAKWETQMQSTTAQHEEEAGKIY